MKMQPIHQTTTTTINPQFSYLKFYHVPMPRPSPAAMPLYDYSEQAVHVQRVPWTELQNSMAMAAYYNDLLITRHHDHHPHHHHHITGSDDFMMYCFKIQQCPAARGQHHDWTDCPYLHPGEKARRRDPRRCLYSGKACGEFRKRGQCEHGDRCLFAHGVFETWLHPDKYKTQMCRDLGKCQRKVCFFAHSPEERREGDGVVDDGIMPDDDDDVSPKSILSMDDKSPPRDWRIENVMEAMERLRLDAINGENDGVESVGIGTQRLGLYPKDFSFFEHKQEGIGSDDHYHDLQYGDQEASHVDWIIANLLDS